MWGPGDLCFLVLNVSLWDNTVVRLTVSLWCLEVVWGLQWGHRVRRSRTKQDVEVIRNMTGRADTRCVNKALDFSVCNAMPGHSPPFWFWLYWGTTCELKAKKAMVLVWPAALMWSCCVRHIQLMIVLSGAVLRASNSQSVYESPPLCGGGG